MKTIRVVAAITKAVNEKGETIIFATQRGYGDFKGGWEFPGGKIEEGETPQEALKREIMEELETEIIVGELIDTIEYDYPTFHLSMDCFWAEIVSGDLVLKEVASILNSTAKESGFAIRYGGDEFLMMGTCDSEEAAALIQSAIEQRISEAVPLSNAPVRLSASIGYILTSESDTEQSLDEYISQADRMMYQIKKERKQGR